MSAPLALTLRVSRRRWRQLPASAKRALAGFVVPASLGENGSRAPGAARTGNREGAR